MFLDLWRKNVDKRGIIIYNNTMQPRVPKRSFGIAVQYLMKKNGGG